MKILAFMQNPWFKPGTPKEWIERYRDDQAFHRRILGRSMSGGRLINAFGQRLFDTIHWDNINWRATEEASGLLPPDYDHIKRSIMSVDPHLIICFGKLAMSSLTEIDPPVPVWGCHHPNARHRTQEELNGFARLVIDFEKQYEAHNNLRTTRNGEDH